MKLYNKMFTSINSHGLIAEKMKELLDLQISLYEDEKIEANMKAYEQWKIDSKKQRKIINDLGKLRDKIEDFMYVCKGDVIGIMSRHKNPGDCGDITYPEVHAGTYNGDDPQLYLHEDPSIHILVKNSYHLIANDSSKKTEGVLLIKPHDDIHILLSEAEVDEQITEYFKSLNIVPNDVLVKTYAEAVAIIDVAE